MSRQPTRTPIRLEGPAFSPFDWWAASARAAEQAVAAQQAMLDAQARMLDAARQAAAWQKQGLDLVTRTAEVQRGWLRLWGW